MTQAASFNVFHKYVWRDFGIFWAFILFNFAVVFFSSWIYLYAGRRLKNVISPQGRKDRKERKRKGQEGSEQGQKG